MDIAHRQSRYEFHLSDREMRRLRSMRDIARLTARLLDTDGVVGVTFNHNIIEVILVDDVDIEESLSEVEDMITEALI